MTRFGYCCPIYSRHNVPPGRSPEEQRRRLLEEGIDRSRIYEVVSGDSSPRLRQWGTLMRALQPGDQLVITELAIFGPHVQDLLPRLQDLHVHDVSLVPLDNEGFNWLSFLGNPPDTHERMTFMVCLLVLEDLAAYEGRYTERHFRTREPRIVPVTRPRGRPLSLTSADIEYIRGLRARGLSWDRISAMSAIPASTVRRHLHDMPRGGWRRADPE